MKGSDAMVVFTATDAGRSEKKSIKRPNGVLCGRCPGYWGKDSTPHGYYGEHINE
jgi:hypothetical protein